MSKGCTSLLQVQTDAQLNQERTEDSLPWPTMRLSPSEVSEVSVSAVDQSRARVRQNGANDKYERSCDLNSWEKKWYTYSC